MKENSLDEETEENLGYSKFISNLVERFQNFEFEISPNKKQNDEKDKKVATRGGATGLIKTVQVQNFMLVVGTSPGSQVASDCTIIRDAVGNFMQFYDKPTLTIRFPEILRQLQGTDTNIEIITSSMLQPLQMSIKGNLISDISAFIFV